jgi:hypothetical protein
MINRFVTGIALALFSLPLTACGGGGDDDSASTQTSPYSGHTYLLSLAKTDWSSPHGVGTDLFGVAPAFLFKVNGNTATLATGQGYYLTDPTDIDTKQAVTPAQATQDPCGITSELSLTGASAAPQASPISMFVKNNGPMPALQVTAPVYNLKFTNILPNGNTPSTTGTLEAEMDFRQLYLLFASLGPTRTPDSVCTSLASHYTPMGCMDASCMVGCTACPDGQPYCLSVKAEDVGAVLADSVAVSDVSAQSRSATSCADSPKPM